MFRPIRAIRPHAQHSPQHLPKHVHSFARCQLRQHFHCAFSTPPRRIQGTLAKRSAIGPVTIFLAVALSTSIAYAATLYISPPGDCDPSHATDEDKVEPVEDSCDSRAPDEADLEMAQTPPGRPGTLTAAQTEKLKEMWAATLDVFGVAGESGSLDGSSVRTSFDNASSAPADSKPKKKKRISLFTSKRDKDSGSDASSTDNDKHGQNKEFQQALASMTPEELRETFWNMLKHDHPDALLLRFLRARKWDVHAALIMMISTMHWRSAEMHVDDDIMLHGEGAAFQTSTSRTASAAEKKEADDFISQIRMGKSFLHGTDKDGRPCCFVRVRLHRQGEQTERSLERFTVYQIESARMLLRNAVDTATIVFDMTDFSMANMDYTPVKFMIKCFEANYPESLGSVLVYKAPWIFQGVWKIIKGWLDPVVASKVHFASNVDDLTQWIPRSHISKDLGGDEDYVYKYVDPLPNENQAMADTATRDKIGAERIELVKSYEAQTVSWIHGEDAGEGRTRLAQRLAENYWRVDPYIRARSLVDRTGVITSGGKLDFYPSTARVASGPTHDDGVD